MSDVLRTENIITGARGLNKEQVIEKLGQMLYDTGCIEKEYIQGMLDKENVFNTFMGNGVAIPHGIEATKKFVKKAGIAIITLPDGVDWGNGNMVRIAIGIAGKENQHIEILSSIAILLSEAENVDKAVNGTADEIYQLFMEADM